MPQVTALRAISKAQNGVGAFIIQCKRIDFHYCDWYGSSRGMNSFITNELSKFGKAHPNIEITVSPRPNKHPIMVGHYINGHQKAICVRNLTKEQVHQKADLLRMASGEKNRKVMRKPVISTNENVRGMWSPFHAGRKYEI
ncbi:hypothetical protein EJ05DRAFT_471657 [Pseudovirgaria hyperparasitica]|uniref:Large ribosomal subunit protein mL43 n=1 Tax=Pseudovirgaria hyperparasitica TaxID=470096 RepID=A0A6A6WKH6_9PEZI|nr:uncharacterized protein EJ05DRAFT_471657 [Pseudovirgaria hyperparasitica]KAF2762694.1 hypothetical protein EJ05DRAFT_471657 [Pseudovirgaria hyperparasitica]